MATTDCIAATSAAIAGLLSDALHDSEFRGATVELSPKGKTQDRAQVDIAIALYHVSRSALRAAPPRPDPSGRIQRPPVVLDLHFGIYARGSDAMQRERLLGFVLATLEKTPVLPAPILNRYGLGETVFGPSETVTLAPESLTWPEVATLNQVIDIGMPALWYVAREVRMQLEGESVA